MQNLELRNQLKKYLASFPTIEYAYLFGSYANGRQHQDSDLDIAIYLNDKAQKHNSEFCSNDNQAKIISELVQITHINDIDLIILNTAPALLKYQIVTSGQRIFCKDDILRKRFELMTIKLYFDNLPLLKMELDYLEKRFAT